MGGVGKRARKWEKEGEGGENGGLRRRGSGGRQESALFCGHCVYPSWCSPCVAGVLQGVAVVVQVCCGVLLVHR